MFDVIYLQIENDGSNEFDDQATWCQDKINDTDVKYILADSKTEAAPDLYWVCKYIEEDGLMFNSLNRDVAKMLQAALAKAEGKS